MSIVAVIGLLFCLASVFFQDWKCRRIHVALPLLIFFFSFYLIQIDSKIMFPIIAFNFLFFIVTLSLLTIYMSLKNKRFMNPFQNYFGLGDLLFYIAITPLFLVRTYVFFFILSMLFAIVLQIGLKKKMNESTVPLAGFSSLLLFIIVIKDLTLHFQKFTLL